MMTWSINLFVLATGFIIVGMYKPKLLLFWMDEPKRMPIVIFSGFLFMVGATMFGEANREKQKWMKEQAQQATETKADSIPAVATKPVAEIIETKIVEQKEEIEAK